MLKINENGRVYGEDIHKAIESKNKNYSDWVRRMISKADLDHITERLPSTGGRPKIRHLFTLPAVMDICLIESNKKASELRQWIKTQNSALTDDDIFRINELNIALGKILNKVK